MSKGTNTYGMRYNPKIDKTIITVRDKKGTVIGTETLKGDVSDSTDVIEWLKKNY